MMAVSIILSLALTYIIGAIPTAYWFGLLKGIDIRTQGSGNVGATNAFRVLGKEMGTAVLLIDIAKGIIPTTIIANCFGLTMPWMLVLIGVTAVCGHNWTVFLNFKGGKGIATTLGVIIGFAIQVPEVRPVLPVVLLTWGIVFICSGYVSLASLIAAVMFPVAMVYCGAPFIMQIMAIVLSVFIVFRHRPNIRRLIEGRENRVNLPFLKK